MKINSLNNYNVQQKSTFRGAFLRTPEFVKFRRQLCKKDRTLLDGYLKNIAAFPDNTVYKYWTVSSYARISQAIGLLEKEILVNYRKELQGSTNKILKYTNPETKKVQDYPLMIRLKGRKGESLKLFERLNDGYKKMKEIHDKILQDL